MHLKLVADADALSTAIVKVLESRQPIATRLVRVQQYFWLRLWNETGATQGIARLPSSPEDIEDHVFMIGRDSSTAGNRA